MKSNYSLFQDLPEFHLENFSYKKVVGDNNLYNLLSNLDLLMQTKAELQKQSVLTTKMLNSENRVNIRNQYKKNLSILEKSLLNVDYKINLFKRELSLVNKKELIDVIDRLSNDRRDTTTRIINNLIKGI